MRPYITGSSGKRTGLHIMTLGAYIGGILLFSIGSSDLPYAVIWQIAGVAVLVAGVYLTVRYSLRSYTYAVEPSGIRNAAGEDVYDLVITEIVGRKQTVVARVAVRDIDLDGMRVVTRGEKIPATKDPSVANDPSVTKPRVFRYANTPILPKALYIPIPDEGSALLLPYDQDLCATLRTAVL